MTNQDNLILALKEVSATGANYRIKKPSKAKWVLNVAIFLAFYVIWYVAIRYAKWDVHPDAKDIRILIISLVLISVISPVLSVSLWNWIGRWVAKKLV